MIQTPSELFPEPAPNVLHHLCRGFAIPLLFEGPARLAEVSVETPTERLLLLLVRHQPLPELSWARGGRSELLEAPNYRRAPGKDRCSGGRLSEPTSPLLSLFLRLALLALLPYPLPQTYNVRCTAPLAS